MHLQGIGSAMYLCGSQLFNISHKSYVNTLTTDRNELGVSVFI